MFEAKQKVWCAIYGAGVVVEVQHASGGVYPVVAVFKNNNGDENVVSYTRDGKFYAGGNVTLYTYPIEIVKTVTKPSIDWSHVSENFQWLAMDSGGLHHLFSEEPELISTEWTTHALYIYAEHFASFTPGSCDWQDSLVKRPD